MEKTIKILRNGIVHQISISPLSSIRYFGGGGTSVETVDPYAGTGVRELYKALSQWIQPQIGKGITPYGGERVAGITPSQETAFGMAGGYAPGVRAGLEGFGQFDPSRGLGLLGAGEQALQGAIAPYDPAKATEFWETAYKRPALETWRKDIMPSIMEKGVRSAGTADSGPMQRELARSGETLATNLSGQLAGLLYGGQQAQLGRQLQGAGMAGQMAGIPGQLAGQGLGMAGQGLGQMAGMGAEQRGIGQQFLGAEQQKWTEAQPWNNPYLRNFLGTALGQPPMEVVGQEQGPGLGSMLMGPLGGFLGSETGAGMLTSGLGSLGGMLGGLGGLFGGGAGAGAAGGAVMAGGADALLASLGPLLMLSDVRLKENFARIENALEKVTSLEGKTYNFKISPNRKDGGLIAQELEKVLPEAVAERNGIKYIKLDAVVALLVNAVKELNQKVESRYN